MFLAAMGCTVDLALVGSRDYIRHQLVVKLSLGLFSFFKFCAQNIVERQTFFL
jgi:hypothetical protein